MKQNNSQIFGLPNETLKKIKGVLTRFDQIKKVRIFGSRAMEINKNGSDIDLAIEGKDLELEILLKLRVELSKLMLPYRFDLVDFDHLKNADLRDHIEQIGQIIFDRKEKI